MARLVSKHNPPSPARQGNMLHLKLARSIGERILGGTHAPGTLLPNEAEWGRIYGVSRTAVREAIKTLNGKGLLVSKPKVGSRVEPRERWNLLDRDVLAWHCHAMEPHAFLMSVQEVRKIFEPEIAALAAVKGTPSQIEALKTAFHGMKMAKSAAETVAPDVDFHQALLSAANNDLLRPFGIVIEAALANLFSYTSAHNPYPELSLKKHEAIVRAVSRRQVEGARRAVHSLLRDTDSTIETARLTKP